MTSILVAVDGSEASMEGVTLACAIARRNKGRVYVVHVIEVPRSLALDVELQPEAARGEGFLIKAEQVAREADFRVESELLQAREVGPALVDAVVERGADLIILGMGYKRPFGEFELGRITQYVLKNAPCHVWVCRHPPEKR